MKSRSEQFARVSCSRLQCRFEEVLAHLDPVSQRSSNLPRNMRRISRSYSQMTSAFSRSRIRKMTSRHCLAWTFSLIAESETSKLNDLRVLLSTKLTFAVGSKGHFTPTEVEGAPEG